MPGNCTVIDQFGEAHRQRFKRALSEIRNGRKSTDWMWFVFPQIRGLGKSTSSLAYAVQNIGMAMALLEDEQFRGNFQEIVDEVRVQLGVPGKTLELLMGGPDDRKLVSSLTLFAEAARRLDLHDLDEACTQVLRRARREGFRTCQATEDFIRADDLGHLPAFIELLDSLQSRRQEEKGRNGRKESWNRYYKQYAPAVESLLGP